MKNRLLSVVILFILAASHAAYGDSLQVRPASESCIEAKPKQVSSLTVRLTNNDLKNYEVISNVTLPEGWALITEDFPFDLASNQSLTKMISFFIPESTPPGRYKITYLLMAKRYPEIRDFYTFDINILPDDSLEVIALEGPQFITAGSQYQPQFLVANKSNRENSVTLTAKSSSDFPLTIDSPLFELLPRESRKVTVTIATNGDISRLITHRLELTAVTNRQGNNQTRASSSVLIDVIPKISQAQQIVQTIVARDTIAQITGQQYENQPAYALVEVNEPALAFVHPVPNKNTEITVDDFSKKKMLTPAIA